MMAAAPAASAGALVPVAARREAAAARPGPKKILDEDAYIEVRGGRGRPRALPARLLAA